MKILGISCFYHDSACALIENGKLVAAAEEERFNRIKHYCGFPSSSVKFCLEQSQSSIEDIDCVVFYEKPGDKLSRILANAIDFWPRSWRQWSVDMPEWICNKLNVTKIIQLELKHKVRVEYCQHHISHGASAYLVSPFDKAAIISVDGVGEWTTTAWGEGRDRYFRFNKCIKYPHSVGLLFSTITSYLGFQVNDAEWKVMGLAPYGEPTMLDKMREVVDLRNDGSFRLNLKYFSYSYSNKRMFNKKWEKLFGAPQRDPESELTDFHKDFARSGQAMVEEIMVKMATHVRNETGLSNLCMAGGVSLNCVANWKIFQEAGFDNIWIQPAAGDSGGALGSAFWYYNMKMHKQRSFSMQHVFWGPSYSDEEIKQFLDTNKISYYQFDTEDDLISCSAQSIADGKVIGWFQGRMEYGPRALGARSILADPRRDDMKNIINAKIKFREKFRPFAPAVLKEKAHEFFEIPKGMDAPYMLLVPKVREDKKSQIPAVTHKDGTGRIQTVTEDTNPKYYRLIKKFGDITSISVILNTSFNVRGDPIVCNPFDAYQTFLNTGMDELFMGNFRIVK